MTSLEECTWHESHVVWHFPPSACVHVTHGTWNMDHGSERNMKVRNFPLTWIKPRNSLGEKKEFSGGRKGKEKKGERKKKGKEKKKRNEKKKGGGKQKRGGKKICAWERRKKGKERKRAPIPDVPTVGS